MTFDQWLNEVENWSTRGERLDDTFGYLTPSQFKDVYEWMRDAWCVGYNHRNEELMDDGK